MNISGSERDPPQKHVSYKHCQPVLKICNQIPKCQDDDTFKVSSGSIAS